MGKSVFIGVIAVVAIVLIVLLAGVLGFIDLGFLSFMDEGNGVPSPSDLGINESELAEFDNFDIYTMLCLLSGKSLDMDTTIGYIESLNMRAYGSSGSYIDIYGQYSLYYENDGWNIEYRNFPVDTAIIVYSKSGQGAAVITSSIAEMNTMYGYNTMTLTSTGSIGTYTAFISFVSSS